MLNEFRYCAGDGSDRIRLSEEDSSPLLYDEGYTSRCEEMHEMFRSGCHARYANSPTANQQTRGRVPEARR